MVLTRNHFFPIVRALGVGRIDCRTNWDVLGPHVGGLQRRHLHGVRYGECKYR
jgi:hypothetical protein